MTCCKSRRVVVLAILLLFLTNFAPVSAQRNSAQLVSKREVTINVKVVLVGFDSQSVNTSYLIWNSPQTRYQLTLLPGLSTDTTYSIQYDVAFAPSSFVQDFASYLNSIGKVEKRTNVLWNESYFTIQGSYFLNYTHYPINATNTLYSADDVESWLLRHSDDYGGLEPDGYTLIIADLSKQLPSVSPKQFESLANRRPVILTPHFYNKTFTDHDLDIKLNRRYMTAWGGHSRLFFIDLSAGPGHAAEQLPIQLASWANSMKPDSPYWSSWLTQYIADYVFGALYNVFLPDFVYPLNYARTYRVNIFVIDNRSYRHPTIQSTLDIDEVRKQLSSLLSFATVEVDAQYLDLPDFIDFSRVVRSATSPSLAGLTPIVDARLVYDWLSESGQGHIGNFTETVRNFDNYDIPVFVFAFDGNYTFGFTYKEYVARDVDFDRTIWGVALYDMVLISHSATDLVRGNYVAPRQPGLGFGFTNTVIHEVGHMLGLMHPFATSYDPTENFVSSVMAYYPYEDSFSQFDKDALLRGYADQLIRNTVQFLRSSVFDLINWPDIDAANSKLRDAEFAYDTMNYTKATEDAFDAYTSASRAHLLGGGSLSNQAIVWGVSVFSFLFGVFMTAVALRRRARGEGGVTRESARPRCSVCRGDLTWIPQYQRWYCYRCQRYE